MPLRLAFMGTPDFAVPILKAVVASGHEVAAVYSQPPRRSGRRGLELLPSAVAKEAMQLGLPVYTPLSLKTDEEQQRFCQLKLDVAVVAAYGLILPSAILKGPRFGCLNAHASLLPRWRGAAPIQRAIMAGDRQTGMMIMQMDEGLDTGPIALTQIVAIKEDMTAGELQDELSGIGATLMIEALARLANGTLKTVPQSRAGVTYAEKISKNETKIDWTSSATLIHRKICGLAPFPGAWSEFNIGDKVERVKILGAQLLEDRGKHPLTLDQAQLIVSCGEGRVQLTRLQRAGGRVLNREQFLNGITEISLVPETTLENEAAISSKNGKL